MFFISKFFFKQKDVFQLKDMEKIAPKEKGISKYQRHLGTLREMSGIFPAMVFQFTET